MTKHSTSYKTVGNLRHITSVHNAMSIAVNKTYQNGMNVGHYDGGLNILGVLGEYPNTQPVGRGAELIFSWSGLVSEPLPHDAYDCFSPNVLFDFNGSGDFYKNNDPRYFLPIGSKGISLDYILINDVQSLIELIACKSGGVKRKVMEKNWFYMPWLQPIFDQVRDINLDCARGKIKIEIK